jgi:hypothetical protein
LDLNGDLDARWGNLFESLHLAQWHFNGVILSEAKNLFECTEMFRNAQHDVIEIGTCGAS